jgi:hypothetical protein
MKTATLVKECEPGAKAVYRLDPPLVEDPSCLDDDPQPIKYVYVSTASIMGVPETYAFIWDPESKRPARPMLELGMSMRGNVTHAEVLANEGYEIVTEAP